MQLGQTLLQWAKTRPYSMVFLSAILLAASYPPSPLPFLAYIGWVPLLLVLDHKPQPRRAFRYIYPMFVVWNFGVCYWLMFTAFGAHDGSEAAVNFTVGFIASVAHALVMTLPMSLFLWVRQRLNTSWSVWLLVPFWLAFELLDLRWDLTWSWITLGHSQTKFPFWIQYAEWTGVLGISAHILIVNILLYKLLQASGQPQRKPILMGLAGAIAFPLLAYAVLFSEARSVYQPTGKLRVRVIQPNIDPYDKFEVLSYRDQIARFDTLISAKGIDTIDMVVLPETAIPRGMFAECMRSNSLIQPLMQRVNRDSLSLLTGFMEIRYFAENAQDIPPSARKYSPDFNEFFDACRPFGFGYYDACNASAMLRADTLPQATEKSKLVPFVERVPFLSSLTFLKSWNIDLGGAFGNYGLPKEQRNLRTQTGASIAPLICYESQFGDFVGDFVQKGAGALVILTNDGWWRQTSGHIQHAHFSSLRAIETRRDIARSANTGISLFADAHGNLHQQTRWWTPTYIDRTLTLRDSTTLYVRFGDWIGWLALAIAAATIIRLVIDDFRFSTND